MKVKLNPLWWFQSYESYLRVIVLFVILCISAFCTMEKDHALFSIIFSAVLALVFWLIVLLSDFPYSFDLENGTLRYRYTHRIHKYKRSRYVRTELIITQIQRVKVRQNALEKLFNTGHVTFEGKAKPHYLREYKESYKEARNGQSRPNTPFTALSILTNFATRFTITLIQRY